ncbi:OMP_b-brl domain-containing protein [Nitrospira tepida]|uniref:OMP_b-brl domain-containing protein n=1 Tax=Nitrospira tepida TaxID=2973512 RepID=A0AA86T7R0_9BACT|nr:outer membrane beta-barrel protein [Nitrospira tepida]CAI4031878.1 OMP_b-brl domain-containing protein [Nitrospira tepida]
MRLAARSLTVLLVSLALWVVPNRAAAEWYMAGQVGATFADRLKDVEGTNSLTGLSAPDFDLKNSVAYGLKLGYFPGESWVGLEAEAFHTTPHIKNLDDIPGAHFRVTTVGLNLIARYPGRTYQPYIGIGGGVAIGRVGNSPTTTSDTDTASSLQLLAGLRAFVTPRVAVFPEYKYTDATFQFNGAFGSVGGFQADYAAQHLMFGMSYHF